MAVYTTMAKILKTGLFRCEQRTPQSEVKDFLKEIFDRNAVNLDRLLPVFESSKIQQRQLSFPLGWYKQERNFVERNSEYQTIIVRMAEAAIQDCLRSNGVDCSDIDHIVFLSTTGIMTPSPEAVLMNRLPFRKDVKRTPVWGLGCLAGAVGLTRGAELAKANPKEAILVVSAEVCTLAFQGSDKTKKNVIATALFSDGAGAALVVGEEHPLHKNDGLEFLSSRSSLYPDTLEVMGWEVLETGLSVLLHKSIPSLVREELRTDLEFLLEQSKMREDEVTFFAAHPGGAKVLDAMEEVLGWSNGSLTESRKALADYGNMSSATIFYVLRELFESEKFQKGKQGLLGALGPGFSSELLACRIA